MEFDDRDLSERLKNDSTYPEQVKHMLITFDESVSTKEIPIMLQKLWDVVNSKEFKKLLNDESWNEDVLENPLILLDASSTNR